MVEEWSSAIGYWDSHSQIDRFSHFQRLPEISSVKMFNPHCRKVKIVKQPCINSDLRSSEIGSVFAPRTAQFVVGTASANRAMMFMDSLIPGINGCVLIRDENDLLWRIVSPQHPTLKAKRTFTPSFPIGANHP